MTPSTLATVGPEHKFLPTVAVHIAFKPQAVASHAGHGAGDLGLGCSPTRLLKPLRVDQQDNLQRCQHGEEGPPFSKRVRSDGEINDGVAKSAYA